MRAGCYKLILTILTVVGGSALNGCNDRAANQPAPNTHDISSQGIGAADPMSDQYIINAIYYNQRIPKDFYRERTPAAGVFQTIRHIQNTDITSAHTTAYELCADSPHQALVWSEAAKQNLGNLVSTMDENLYFQYTRVSSMQPHISNIQRIYKCGMLDRSLVDLNAPDEHVGFYYQTPQQIGQIKTIIEYLWTFSMLNNYGNAVLKNEVEDTTDFLKYSLYQARLTPGADDDCDTIDIYTTEYLTDKNSGNITYQEFLIDSLKARFENIPVICE